jgi:3-hydroxyacyl-[acyl-carrier-protein] dehydratase
VVSDIDAPGVYSSGIPVEKAAEWRKVVGRLKRIDSLSRRVAKLDRQSDDGERAEMSDPSTTRHQRDPQAIYRRRYPFLFVDQCARMPRGREHPPPSRTPLATNRFSRSFSLSAGDAGRHHHRGAGAGGGEYFAFVTAGVVPDAETRFYFVGIDKARFRKPVEPGDQLVLTAKLERTMRGIWKFSAVALVDDAEVASAELMVAPTGKYTGVS